MLFKNIYGQDKACKILEAHLREGRLASAYLFIGPDGIGKKLLAKRLAQILNCENDFKGCQECVSCRKIENNQHPDIHIIDPTPDETQIKIECIRQMQREINLKPYEGKAKVFIINDAHKLNPDSSNALLKVLEEPPKNSLIILVTARPNLLFKTIISRCQIIKFSSLSREKLEGILRKDYRLDSRLAHLLAYFCEGRIGYALRLLKEKRILEDKNQFMDMFFSPRRIVLENKLLEDKDQLRYLLNILVTFLRDIYLLKMGLSPLELINFDRKTELSVLAEHFSFMDLDHIFNFISDAFLYLEENVNPRLLLAYLKMELWRG
ncbi:MAG: DNA polymerase III subunit delta' [Candidatus Omnitrophica bacterium]|nr:DNA polymerase III subunit delta' [Candidatus Omnitrophota bacterium]